MQRYNSAFFKRPIPISVTVLVCLFVIIFADAGFAEDQRFSVAGSVANIRSGPGTNYDVIWQIEKYHPIVVVEKKGNWYRFRDFENDEGWVHRSLVNETPSVITANDQCNIRSGPGTNHDILFTAEKGIPFKVVEPKGNWLLVEHSDGDRGWIHKSIVW